MRELDWLYYFLVCCFIVLKKILRILIQCWKDTCDDAFQENVHAYADKLIHGVRRTPLDTALNVELSIVSIKLNYGGIVYLSNKLKFGHINIFTHLFILEQKTINTCPSDVLISLKANYLVHKVPRRYGSRILQVTFLAEQKRQHDAQR